MRRRQIKEELDDLRKEREREDARNRAAVADAEEQKEANIRQRRLQGGSRFNLRWRDRMPPEALTPAGVEAALSEYVSFGTADHPDAFGEVAAAPAPGPRGPRKGMLLQDVEIALDPLGRGLVEGSEIGPGGVEKERNRKHHSGPHEKLEELRRSNRPVKTH